MKTVESIMERKAERLAEAKARKAEREENGEVNKLRIERDASGLYYARYTRGPLPEDLKGMFTNKKRILDLAYSRSIPVEA